VPLARLYRLTDPSGESPYSPAHSLIDQSLHSRLGAEATNGDGFGIGWYDDQPTPEVLRTPSKSVAVGV
jgi:predicted glutamine amidotransferase